MDTNEFKPFTEETILEIQKALSDKHYLSVLELLIELKHPVINEILPRYRFDTETSLLLSNEEIEALQNFIASEKSKIIFLIASAYIILLAIYLFLILNIFLVINVGQKFINFLLLNVCAAVFTLPMLLFLYWSFKNLWKDKNYGIF